MLVIIAVSTSRAIVKEISKRMSMNHGLLSVKTQDRHRRGHRHARVCNRSYWKYMNPAIIAACAAKINEAEKPLALSKIRLQLPKPLRFKPAESAEVEQQLAAGQIAKWPVGRGPKILYWHRSLPECAAEALLDFLSLKPAAFEDAVKAVRPRLHKVSKAVAETELKTILPGLLADGRLYQETLGRKIWYFSPVWAQRIGGQSALRNAVLQAVEMLESAPGNYVAVYKLRTAPAVNALFDKAAIALADEGRLVMTDYDGPRPVADEKAHEYVKDAEGRLYIGLARPGREN